MEIHQILIRPQEQKLIVLYIDAVGRRSSLVVEDEVPATAALIAECQRRLPPDSENPARTQTEQEISELEQRLTQLKKSIGTA